MRVKACFLMLAAMAASAVPAMAQPAETVPSPDEAGAPRPPDVDPPPPPPLPPPPPAGTSAEFVSTGAMQWEVMIDRQPVCVTPCSFGVPRGRWISMRTRERRPVRVEVGMLGDRPVTVAAKPLSGGAYATGVTFTALGGIAFVAGLALTSVGCSTDRDGMCTAGLITGGAGAVVTVGAIWLMKRSVPRVRIHPRMTATIGPTGGGIAGVF